MSGSDINDPEWPEIIRAVQDQLQDRIHTSCPAVVKSYDTATQTATVQLVVQLKGEDGAMTTVPELEDVPVCWPGGAAGFLHVPLAAGDTVMVLFSESDFSGWWESGSVSAPKMLARHDLGYAIAIPGLRRAAAPLSVTGGHVTLAASGAVHLGSDAATLALVLQNGPAAWKTVFDAWTTALPATGAPLTDTVFKTAMTALGTALSSAGWPGNFNTTKVKAT